MKSYTIELRNVVIACLPILMAVCEGDTPGPPVEAPDP
jgi:hypothetical protein